MPGDQHKGFVKKRTPCGGPAQIHLTILVVMTPREVLPRRTATQRVVVGLALGVATGLAALWSLPRPDPEGSGARTPLARRVAVRHPGRAGAAP